MDTDLDLLEPTNPPAWQQGSEGRRSHRLREVSREAAGTDRSRDHMCPWKGGRPEPARDEGAPACPEGRYTSLQRDSRRGDIPPAGPAEEPELEEGRVGGPSNAQGAP